MELAFTGGFAWAAWQVLGRLQRHAAKIEKNLDDGILLGQWEDECKAMAEKKERAIPAMGQGAAATAHDHIFEDWRSDKLKLPQKIQLASDLADLAQWAGAGSWVPELRDGPVKSWSEMGMGAKVHLLQAADALQFNFAEVAKQQAEGLAENWLWQVTEALPALSAEPVKAAAPVACLADLKTRLAEADTAVRTAFEAERRSAVGNLKGLVQPLSVASCVRKMQVLKLLLQDVGLTPTAAVAALKTIRTELAAPLTLAAADSTVREQKAAAETAVEASAEAAMATERATREAEIEVAAARTYRRALTLLASSPAHWHTGSDTPALHKLGLLAALLAEMVACDGAGTADGAAAAAEMADAVRKLTPQMRLKLSEDQAAQQSDLLAALTPAPAPSPAAGEQPAAAAAEEGQEEAPKTDEAAEEDKAADGREEAAEAPPAAETARPAPPAAASELRSLLEGVIRGQLAEARAERRAARAAERKAAAKEAAAARKAAAAAAAAAAVAVPAVSDAAPEGGEPAATPEAGVEAGQTEAEAAAAPAAEEAVAAGKLETTEGEPESKDGEEGSKEGPTATVETAVEATGAGAAAAPEGEETAAAGEDAAPAAEEAATVPQISTTEGSGPEASAEGAAAELAVPEQVAEEARSSSEEQLSAAAVEAEEAEEEDEEVVEEEEEPLTAAELVDVEAVRSGVEAEARARADAEKEAALMRLQDALEALRKRTIAEATEELVRQVTAVSATPRSSESGVSESDVAPAGPDMGSRLFTLESLLRSATAAPDSSLAAAVENSISKLTAASDRSALDAASKAALARVEAAVVRVRLTTDVGKMEMGPGCCEVLRRTDGWLAGLAEAEVERQARVAARAARVQARKEAAAAAAAEAAAAAAAAAESRDTVAEVAAAGGEGEGAVAADEDGVASDVPAATSAGEDQTAAASEASAGDAEPKATEKVAEEEEEEAVVEGPPVDTARLSEGRVLVSQLLAEGLVLLELPGPSNRKLQLLRESVDSLDLVDGDGAVQSRLMITLREVVGQLGPIGGCVEARVNQVAAEAERQLLLQVRSAATSIYLALTALLKLEGETWEAAKTNLEQANTAVYGMKIERRADSLAAALSACGLTAERCAALAGAVLGLGTEAAKKPAGVAEGALRAAAEQAHVLSASLYEYISYVRLREHALGAPLTAKADIEEDYELVLPTLSDMTAKHGQDGAVEWLDLAGMGLPAPDEEDIEEGGSEGADGEEGPQSAHERALSELQQRLDGWHSSGLKMLARGQAALVTLGGATSEGGELRLTADLGLPSAKSLLQLGAERLARLQLMAAEDSAGRNSGVQYPVNWYLLVAPAAVAPLTAFLQDNAYFGLQREQVHILPNDVRPPLLNADMQVVLESSGTRVARSAPGSGEVFLALRRSGALSHMRRAGVRWLEVEAVEDNLTARPLDPSFLGACAGSGVHAGAKVAVPGVSTEGPSALPELYSRYLELVGSSSNLLPVLGDAVPAIGTYLFSMAYLNRVDRLLKEQPLALYRLAPADKVPGRVAAAAAAAGKAGSGGGATAAAGGVAAGFKLERRLSDFASPAILRLLPDVRLAMVAVDVSAEFCPVWGAAPFFRTASPKTAVNALLLQHTRWVEDSGGAVADEDGVVEVSPLVSYAGEGLASLVEGKVFEEAYVHELQGFAADATGTASNLGLWALPAVVVYAGAAAVRLLGKGPGGSKGV